MKILIDARLYGLENAGLGRYINNLIDKLSHNDNSNEYVILLRKKYFNLLRLPENWKKVLADFGHYGFSEQIVLPFILNQEKADIIHFPHFNVPIIYCYFVKYFRKEKIVVTIHDLLMHTQKGKDATTLTPLIYLIKRLVYYLVFFVSVKTADKILVPSNSIKIQLGRYYQHTVNKIVVTYEGVDIRIKSNGSGIMTEPYFIYVGNVYPHKNIKRLIEAIVHLNKIYPQRTLLLIACARNNFTHRLEKMINKSEANRVVRMLGYVDDRDLGTFMSNSVGFVFPSLSEGFGLPGLEALKSGTLLLSSDIQVFREVYQDNAIYFNQLDFSSIEKSMEMALSMSKKERLIRIRKGQEFVKQYSWTKMASETLKVYIDLFN